MSPTRSATNPAVQPYKMARGLKFSIKEAEGLCYLCREKEGADQLRGYQAANLRLCFRICKNRVFAYAKIGFSHDGAQKYYIIIDPPFTLGGNAK